MHRRAVYFAVLGSIVLLALGLRVHSGLQRTSPPFTAPPVVTHARDFVRHPRVAPEEVDRGPRRIISLAPSNTEIICALGLGDRLIGRTQYCTYPPEVARVPVVGALTDPNYEKIRSLQPDLVLVTANSREVIRKLEAIGVRCEAIEHDSLEDVYAAIARVGALTDRPHTAEALIGAIWTDIHRLRESGRGDPGLRVLIALSIPVPPRGVYVAGPGTFLDDLLTMAGYRNAIEDLPRGAYAELPLEKLRELSPDVIVDFGEPRSADQEQEMYASWSSVPGLAAFEQRRILAVGGPEWLSAGPRIAIALERLITRLQQVR